MNILLVEDRQLEHPLLDGLEIDQCDNVEDAKEKLLNGKYDALIFDTVIWYSRTKNYLVNIYKDLLPWYYTKIKNKETRQMNLIWTTAKDQIRLEKTHKETYWVVTAEKNSGALTIVLDILEKVHTGQEVGQIENVEIGTGEGEWSDVTSPYTVSSISDLKHRIAHLFLSMDVDLQGMGVLRKQGAGGKIQNAVNTPEAYLRDVLNNKEKTYYRQKLADLHFLVAKVSEGGEEPFLKCDGEPSGGQVRPTLSESNLPNDEDKAIVDLISEEKRNDDSIVRLWSTLVDLSGLKLKDANKPFENISSYTNCRFFKFMCLMDCEIDKKDNINEQDVNDVMDFFAKIEGGKGWTIKGANPSPIKCFNDWFCALDDCLEKLREVIKPD